MIGGQLDQVSGWRYFGAQFNVGHAAPTFDYCFDKNASYTDGSTLRTGAWRPITPDDFADITITGASISIGAVAVTGGSITTNPAGSSTVSNDGVSGVFGTVLSANAARKAWFIQNLHTGSLLLRYSASNPSTGNLNMILKGGTSVNDGGGASFSDFDGKYKGAVSVTGLGGAPVLITAWEL